MKILFTVQRYGIEIAGGAEQHCRWLAESLHRRGHEVHVVTSRAADYMTWADHFDDDEEVINGVLVHRFPVEKERDIGLFNRVATQIDFHNHTTPISLEKLWLREQGPSLIGARTWLRTRGFQFDVAVPFTYLYATSQIATDSLHGLVPIVMHATAHDEYPFYMRLIGRELDQVTEFLCSTPEEADLLQNRLSGRARTNTVGIGVELAEPSDRNSILRTLGIPEDPYFVVLGRIDPSKGVDSAAKMFQAWRALRMSNVNLLAIGGRSVEFEHLDLGDGVYSTGFVDEVTKSSLLHGCVGLIQPSPYESFSLALCEAWLAGRPSLATASSEVLVGQTRRSGGGLLYGNESEFHDGLTQITDDPARAREMGRSGQSYVKDNFITDVVVSRIEMVLERVVSRFMPTEQPQTEI